MSSKSKRTVYIICAWLEPGKLTHTAILAHAENTLGRALAHTKTHFSGNICSRRKYTLTAILAQAGNGDIGSSGETLTWRYWLTPRPAIHLIVWLALDHAVIDKVWVLALADVLGEVCYVSESGAVV